MEYKNRIKRRYSRGGKKQIVYDLAKLGAAVGAGIFLKNLYNNYKKNKRTIRNLQRIKQYEDEIQKIKENMEKYPGNNYSANLDLAESNLKKYQDNPSLGFGKRKQRRSHKKSRKGSKKFGKKKSHKRRH